MGGQTEDQLSPLLRSSSSFDASNLPLERTGTTWTAVSHIITGVIGAGVLSLAWSIAQLGWIAGPLSVLLFAAVTLVSTNLLCDCYRYPNPEHGPARIQSYTEAVKLYLGERQERFCAFFVYLSLYGTGIAYTITTATSIRAIQKSNCYHKQGHEATCSYGDTLFMLLFGALQILVSQIPDFHNMVWLSVIAAVMSFSYASIGLALGFRNVIANGTIKGSISGVPASNATNKLWLTFQALGDIAYAYPYSIIVLEIQDTLKSPPSENKTMKKASAIAVFITTFFYLFCGCFGYASFGNDTPGNLLTGFGFYEPYWLIDFANACVVLHLVGGYQIYSQPIFAVAERWFRTKFQDNGFVNSSYNIKFPLMQGFQVNPFRLCFRTAYVLSTTAIAIMFPYFNQVLGVLGALNFWPLAIYFPVEMYCRQKNIGTWSKKRIILSIFSFVCFVVSVMGFIGSIEGIITLKLS